MIRSVTGIPNKQYQRTIGGLAITSFLMALAIGTAFAAARSSPQSESRHGSYQLLFIGNSHSAANDLPQLVATMIETGLPAGSASAELAAGFGFLSDRLADGVTQQSLESRAWTHVILQGQKYSSSGSHTYPTYGAEEWIRRVRATGAEPILFPEWSLEGNPGEAERVYNLHLEIASHETACVAPVGMAWEEAKRRFPTVDLYATDGNHSNLNGSTLAAFVLYQAITGQPASGLPHLAGIDVNSGIQQNLKDVATGMTAMKKRSSGTIRNAHQKRKLLQKKKERTSRWCHP